MDKIDRKILSLLQENARYPLKYLAQKVFLSYIFIMQIYTIHTINENYW